MATSREHGPSTKVIAFRFHFLQCVFGLGLGLGLCCFAYFVLVDAVDRSSLIFDKVNMYFERTLDRRPSITDCEDSIWVVWFFEHFIPPEGPIENFPRILHWMNINVGDNFVKRSMKTGVVLDEVYIGASTKDKKEYRPTPKKKDAQPTPKKIQKRKRRESFMRALKDQEFVIEELKRRVPGLEAQLAEEEARRKNQDHGEESAPRTEPSMNTGFVSPSGIDTNQPPLKTYGRVGSRRRYKGRALRTPYTRTVVLRIKNE
ncbi:hypothetical protein LR48_Vigan09g120500 [Vigna angularis]|uniref:Uncharacterized protein n=1 Tax=Phaseolus angularis TaxID=3914 RepID=A0A0L9VBV8_PHAAN|nr:hypothetical protein LR48_Vigan09g120500 [Vigna angularis]